MANMEHAQSAIDEFYALSRSVDVILMTSLLSLAAVVGAIGNALVILVCYRYPSTKSTQTFVLALAVADLVVSTFIVPFRIITYHIRLPEIACKATEGAIYMACHQSNYLLTLIAIDRYFAICRPTSGLLTRRRAKLLIVITVFLSAAFATPAALMAGIYVVIPLDSNNVISDPTASSLPARLVFTGICNSDGSDHRYFSKRGVFTFSCLLITDVMSQAVAITVLYAIVFYTLYRRFGIANCSRGNTASSGNSNTQPFPALRRAEVSLAVFAETLSVSVTVSQAAENVSNANLSDVSSTKQMYPRGDDDKIRCFEINGARDADNSSDSKDDTEQAFPTTINGDLLPSSRVSEDFHCKQKKDCVDNGSVARVNGTLKLLDSNSSARTLETISCTKPTAAGETRSTTNSRRKISFKTHEYVKSYGPNEMLDDSSCLSPRRQGRGRIKLRNKRQGNGQVSCAHTAKILLAVTLTAMALNVPFAVIKLRLLPNIITLRLLFFCGCAANPIIYCISSQQFRRNIQKLLQRLLHRL